MSPCEGAIAILMSCTSSEEQSDGEGRWRLGNLGVGVPEIDTAAYASVGSGHDDRPSGRGPGHDVHHQRPWCARSITRDAEPAKTFPDEADNLDAGGSEAGFCHLQRHALRAEAVRAVEALLKLPLIGGNVPTTGATLEGKARQEGVEGGGGSIQIAHYRVEGHIDLDRSERQCRRR